MRAILGAIFCLFLVIAPALAERRLALVVGNDHYQNLETLDKARADAKTYANVLREKGFEVQEGYDLTFFDFNHALSSFVEKIHPGDVAVFAFSGHGWSDGEFNYLVSIDAPAVGSERELAGVTTAIRNSQNGVIDQMEASGAKLNVAIIDACRDNPFRPAAGHKSFRFARGLAPMTKEPGTFVVFSAGPGQSALDRLKPNDPEPNSVFTRVFAPLLGEDIWLNDAIKASQPEVERLARLADHDQRPDYSDGVDDLVCLSAGCKSGRRAEPPAPAPGFAALIDAMTDATALEKLAAGWPDGPLKAQAMKRVEALRQQASPTVSDSKPLTPTPFPPPFPSPSGDVLESVIDAATSADILAPLIAKLPDGPLKERAKARAEALKNFPVANLPPVPPQPSPSGPCDVLVDENSNANAVLAKDIDAGLQACEAAVAGHPDELRFARLLQVAQEQRAFQRALRSPDRGPSEAYLTLYPSGRFADDVKRHLAGLSVAPSPPVPSNPPPEPPKPKIDPVDFARMLQAELKRVGCYPVAIDGNWGASSEQALAQFNQHTHNSFDVKVASLEAIEAVRSTAGRVCPLTCGPGERVSGERCAPIDCGQGRHLSGSVCISDNRKIPRPRSSAAARSNCFAFNGDKYCD